MQTITEQLKTGEFSRYHLIYGEERYMVRYYKKCLKDKLSNPDDEMNCTVFQGEKTEASAIAEAGQVLPFFAPQRLIIVQDSGFFKKASDMADYMDALPETTYLVFLEHEVDKRNRLYKWMNKNGCVTECKPQNASKIGTWIASYGKRAGKVFSKEAIQLLVERVGTDMDLLSGEIEKLIGYTGARAQIGVSDVEAVSSGVTVSKIFDMIDAVAQGERERALRLYDDLLANREAPMSILYLFTRHINILLQVKELTALGLSSGELAKRIGIPPFTVSKYGRQAKLFKRGKLLQMLEDRADYEERFKSGRLTDQLAVELFLIQALTNS